MRSLRPLAASVAAVGILGLAGCGGDSAAGDDGTVTFGYWSRGTGYLGMTPEVLAQNPEVGKEHGVRIEAKPYDNLQELYSDVARGRIDIALASPDAPAAQATQGAPVSIIGTLAESTTGLVGKKADVAAADIDGKRVAMATNAGVSRLLRAQIEDKYDLTAGKDYEVVPAQDNAQAVSQVSAGTADFAMTWEPHTTRAMEKNNLKVAASPSDLAFEDHKSWQFVIFGSNDLDDSKVEPVMSTIADGGKWMEAHPEEMDDMAVEFGQEAGTITELIDSGRSPIAASEITDGIREDIESDFSVLVETGGLEEEPPKEVFRQ